MRVRPWAALHSFLHRFPWSFLPAQVEGSTVPASRVERPLGAQTLSIETGKLAKQAHGAVVVQYGDTVTLVTAVEGEADEGRDFFPLVVAYPEQPSAART